MDKESLTEKLLDLVEGRETPESWRNWWDEHETELEALLSRGEFLKLKPCRHGFQWVPVFGSQKRAIAILEKSGTAFEASNLYQERYLAELDAFCKEQERVQREKQKEFKANNPELFGRYPKFSKALAKALDPSDEIKPAATEVQIGNQESVLDFTLLSQVREFFLLTAGLHRRDPFPFRDIYSDHPWREVLCAGRVLERSGRRPAPAPPRRGDYLVLRP